MRPFRQLWRERGPFLRAQLSSGAATAVDWVLMTGLVTAGVHYLFAAASGALVGAGADFFLKKWWAFSARRGPLHREARRYAMVSVASAAFNTGVSYLLVDGVRLPPVPGVIAASMIVSVFWNYPLQRTFVFARGKGKP